MNVELVILVDNLVGRADLRAEHGLAVLVAAADRRVLFDAGATAETLLHNARALGADLGRLDAAVVSHGHYDHTGGLAAVARARRGLAIHAHPEAFSRRWSDRRGKPLKDVACPHGLRKLRDAGAVFRPVAGPEMLYDGLVLSGPVGGRHDRAEPFVIRRDEQIVVDDFRDELFALLRGSAGWVLLSGCCHRGVRNTLRAARFLTHGEPIVAVVGGLHLRSSTEPELEAVAALLGGDAAPRLYLCHCTGQGAIEFLRRRLGERVQAVAAGTTLTF